MLEQFKEAVPVLDHGFVRVVDWMGSDARVVQAARVSYGEGTKTVREDRGLIRYLMRHHHGTPFEKCIITLHIKVPIFIHRQWIRYRTASTNEYSARYSVMSEDTYLPELKQMRLQSKTNGQGRGEVMEPLDAATQSVKMAQERDRMRHEYNKRINAGMARELARIHLPLSQYTEMYWTINLRNLLHVIQQRLHPHAQWEFQQYAQVLADITRAWVPHTWEAFEDYRLRAHTFSREEVALLKQCVNLAELRRLLPDSGLTKRERAAMFNALR